MKVLHICSDFSNQSIYNQLVTNLSINSIDQEVYVPVRRKEEIGRYQNKELKNVNYRYSFILNKIDRINYFGKINKIEKDLSSHITVQNCDLIHAHFLFSDGGAAYKLYLKYKIPYIVAIRNTDINVFFKYFLHLRPFAMEILKCASQIIFLSPKYRDNTFKNYIPKKYKEAFLKKTKVISNGVNQFWLNNSNEKKFYFEKEKINFLYVGDFSKNKNIQFSIKSLQRMRKTKKNIEFVVVGGGGDFDLRIKKLVDKHSNWIKFIERTTSLEKLAEIYKKSDIFLMPSKLETFGLVYIEAMSQGLPVIYTEGQGIDGYFINGEIGFSVKLDNVNDFIKKVNLIIDNYNKISSNCILNSKQFSWQNISKTYIELYNKLVKNNK